MSKIKNVAFIGGGIDSGIGKIHFKALSLYAKFSLVAGFFSNNRKKNIESSKFYGVSKNRTYNSVSALLKNEKNLNAIILLTPITGRLSYVNQILKSKIPLISEKPFLSNLAEMNLVKKKIVNKFFRVTYNYSGYPIVREIRSLIDNGKIGKINKINIEMPSSAYLNNSASKKSIAMWRLKDGKIPTVFLDLGSHIFNLIYFLSNSIATKLVTSVRRDGKFANIVDDVVCFGELKNRVSFNVWFSKSAVGYDNGLKIRVFGSKGSLEWIQTNSEYLKISLNDEKKIIVNRGNSTICKVASKKRYNIFKSGHPTGFLEAFGNLYFDIYQDLDDKMLNNKLNKYTFDFVHSYNVIKTLDCMQKSWKKKSWQKL